MTLCKSFQEDLEEPTTAPHFPLPHETTVKETVPWDSHPNPPSAFQKITSRRHKGEQQSKYSICVCSDIYTYTQSLYVCIYSATV